VNLTLGEVAELPLPAALFGADDHLVASTPEWTGSAPGAVTLRVRGHRLVVGTERASSDREDLVALLLDSLDSASRHALDGSSLQVRMLATALRLLAGRVVDGAGSSDHVVHFASAGVRARTGLEVTIEDHAAWEVRAPEVAALVLVQLAVNAERHGRARAVTISQSTQALHVGWRGRSGDARVRTARRRGDRDRWGLGFARIAADALGGVVYALTDAGDGACSSTLELGVSRLALPLAAVRRGVIAKATRAWDEETGLLPGTPAEADARLVGCIDGARSADGAIASSAGWHAREGVDLTWIAIPPDGTLDRMRDLVDGLAHERALWEGVREPDRSRIAAVAALLASAIGTPLARSPALAWTRRMRELSSVFSLPMAVPECQAVGALDPQVTALLACEVGACFEVDGERMWLRTRPDSRGNPLLRALPDGQRELIPIA